MVKCNQICPWNYYEIGCKKPNDELCPMSNLAAKEKPKTNADRIRAMTDAELAQMLCAGVDIQFCHNLPECAELLDTDDGVPEEKCMGCLMAWLRQPAEGE